MTKPPSLRDESLFAAPRTLSGSAELELHGIGSFKIEKVATVGRAPESDIVVNVRSVSRHHARIFFEGGHFWIKDLESGNGTQVNGKKVSLQMLSDNDALCFGEARGVFRCSTVPSGPVPIARDPLEGSDPFLQDGTPTGGLRGQYPALGGLDQPGEDRLRAEAATHQREIQVLQSKIATLQTENEMLRRELVQPSGAIAPAAPPDKLKEENERLRKLVQQLERALADSNVRLRNLQSLLGKGKK